MAENIALITGASYGVGQAAALTFAGEGFDLAITATRAENLAETEDGLRNSGVRVLPLVLDLRDDANIKDAVAEVSETLGVPDLLVNNGAAIIDQAAVDVTPDDWDTVLNTNLKGTFFLTQAVGKRMIERGDGGSIVSVSSSFAFKGAPNRLTYGVSKAGLINMTKMLAIEWADHNIRVNAVAPGRLDTPSPARAHTAGDPAYMEAMLKRIPLHRITTADEVVAAISYLAGPGAASVTGHTIVLDGGLTA